MGRLRLGCLAALSHRPRPPWARRCGAVVAGLAAVDIARGEPRTRRRQDHRRHHPRLRGPAGCQGGDRPLQGRGRGPRLHGHGHRHRPDNAAINGEITTAVAQKVDAIVTAFGTPQEFGEGLAAAGAAGVPVFGLDTGGVVEPTLVNVTTDTHFLGRGVRAGDHRRAGRHGQGRDHPLRPVRAGPSACRGGQGPRSRPTASRSSSTSRATPRTRPGFAKATALDLLTKYPKGDLDAIWAGWDASALGAYQATQETGRTEVLVTGVDGQDFAQAEVAKGGNWIATVRQDWPTIATTLADIIDAHFAGTDPTDSTVFVPGGPDHQGERAVDPAMVRCRHGRAASSGRGAAVLSPVTDRSGRP